MNHRQQQQPALFTSINVSLRKRWLFEVWIRSEGETVKVYSQRATANTKGENCWDQFRLKDSYETHSQSGITFAFTFFLSVFQYWGMTPREGVGGSIPFYLFYLFTLQSRNDRMPRARQWFPLLVVEAATVGIGVVTSRCERTISIKTSLNVVNSTTSRTSFF